MVVCILISHQKMEKSKLNEDIDIDPEEIKSFMSGNLEITLSEIKKFKDMLN